MALPQRWADALRKPQYEGAQLNSDELELLTALVHKKSPRKLDRSPISWGWFSAGVGAGAGA
jgi:hypothetical protein